MSIFTDKWTDRFMDMAFLVASWSKDPSTKVGAVVVDHERSIVSLGFNGFPRHVIDDTERYLDKKIKYAMIVHAEANAILSARCSLVEKILFATKSPCSECVKLIIQCGISTIVSPAPDLEGKWADDAMVAGQMLMEAGVIVETWRRKQLLSPTSSMFPLLSDDELRDVVACSDDSQKISLALEVGLQRETRGDVGTTWLSRSIHDHARCECKLRPGKTTHTVGMPESCENCSCR